jgi:hypothetical protein
MTGDELERLRPSDGARFLLELERVDGARARYRAWIVTPGEAFSFAATLDEDGGSELVRDGGEGEGDAAAELMTMLTQLAKLTARAAKGKRAEGLAPWPPRVLRWRGPGR